MDEFSDLIPKKGKKSEDLGEFADLVPSKGKSASGDGGFFRSPGSPRLPKDEPKKVQTDPLLAKALNPQPAPKKEEPKKAPAKKENPLDPRVIARQDAEFRKEWERATKETERKAEIQRQAREKVKQEKDLADALKSYESVQMGSPDRDPSWDDATNFGRMNVPQGARRTDVISTTKKAFQGAQKGVGALVAGALDLASGGTATGSIPQGDKERINEAIGTNVLNVLGVGEDPLDMVTGIVAGGTLGAAIPAAGKALKAAADGVRNAVGKPAVDAALKRFAQSLDNIPADILKGRGIDPQTLLDDVARKYSQFGEPTPGVAFRPSQTTLLNQAVDADEFADLIPNVEFRKPGALEAPKPAEPPVVAQQAPVQEPPAPVADAPIINTIFTDEMAEAARERIRQKMARAGTFDPSLFQDYAIIGGYHLEKGVREFGAWSAKMVEEFGEGVRPMLRQIWDESNGNLRKFAASNRATDDIRESVGLPQNFSKRTGSTADNIAEARLDYDLDATVARAKAVNKGGKNAPLPSGKDIFHINFALSDLTNRYNSLTKRINDGIVRGENVAELIAARDSVRETLDEVTQASRAQGTAQSEAFRNRGLATFEDYTPAGLYNEWQASAGRKLTDAEKEAADRIGIRETELTQRINELEAKLRDAELQQNVKTGRSGGSAPVSNAQREVIRARRSSAIERAKAKLGENPVVMNDPFLLQTGAKLASIAPEILEVAKSYIDEGIVVIDDLVRNVRKDFGEAGIEVSEEDVKRSIAGEYSKPKGEKRPTTALQEIRKSLRDEFKAERDRIAEEEKRLIEEGERIIREADAAGRKRAIELSKEMNAKAKAERLAKEKALREEERRAAKEIADAEKAAKKAELQAEKEAKLAQVKAEKEAKMAAAKTEGERIKAQREADREAARIEREEKARLKKEEAEQARRDLKAFNQQEREAAKAERERIAQARKEGAKAESEARKEYKDWWKNTVPAQRERLYEQIQSAKQRIESGQVTYQPKPKPPKELNDLLIQREALRVEADEIRNKLKAEQEWKETNPVIKGFVGVNLFLRNINASTDFSAVLNQGAFFAATRPKIAAQAAAVMLKAAKSPEVLRKLQSEVRLHPNYAKAKAAGLKIATEGMDQTSGQTLNNIIGKFPLIAGSDRAYTAFLTKLRFDVFNRLVETQERPWMKALGVKELTPDELKQIAEYVNTATGAGTGAVAQGLNMANNVAPLGFAPGYLVSRWKLAVASPAWNAAIKRNPRLASAIMADYGKFAFAVGGTISAMNQLGYDVEADPRSSDFGKIKTKEGTKIDPFGGILNPLRIMAQLSFGTKKGGNVNKPNPGMTLGYYGVGKASPLVRHFLDVGTGGAFGKKYDTSPDGIKNFAMSFAPISIQTGADIWTDPKLSVEQKAALTLGATFGMNVNTPVNKVQPNNRN